ncbi:MAG: glycosyltransferase family 1 protein [Deltaproteobacteria bacterium]|nr:glycosyltransferase family 1 protein [Deltaproteobacteria bacterium]
MRRIAVLSVHSCPLAALGGKETGGMNVYVRELSREMGRLGLRVDVFTRSQNPHISRIVSMGRKARVIHLQAGPEEPVPKNEILNFLPEFTSRIVQFAKENKICYDLVHSHYWLSGWVGEHLKGQWSIPLVHMFHTLGVLKNSVRRKGEEKETRDRLRVEKQIMDVADCLIAPSPWEREQMILHNPAKILVIPCGVDLTLFKPLPAMKAKKILGLSEREFVLFVGRIDAIKGIDVLIRAINHLSRKPWGRSHSHNLGLIIIGGELDADHRAESQEMQKLRKMVNRMKLHDKVAFWGSQRQDLLPYFYSAAKALVLSSRYESFGMVALEAMACGTPVIASRVGGLQYTVKDGQTGFLVPEGDWKALADRIQEVIENPPLAKKLTRAALAKVKQFSWPAITKKVMSLYDSLIKP